MNFKCDSLQAPTMLTSHVHATIRERSTEGVGTKVASLAFRTVGRRVSFIRAAELGVHNFLHLFPSSSPLAISSASSLCKINQDLFRLAVSWLGKKQEI
jgi:hypothetical protein